MRMGRKKLEKKKRIGWGSRIQSIVGKRSSPWIEEGPIPPTQGEGSAGYLRPGWRAFH